VAADRHAVTLGNFGHQRPQTADYTAIRFVWDSAKFGMVHVVRVNETLVDAKMCTFTLEFTHFIFSKYIIYTHDGASAKFSNISHETDYSVFHDCWPVTDLWVLTFGIFVACRLSVTLEKFLLLGNLGTVLKTFVSCCLMVTLRNFSDCRLTVTCWNFIDCSPRAKIRNFAKIFYISSLSRKSHDSSCFREKFSENK
jgi:hypothetical protein